MVSAVKARGRRGFDKRRFVHGRGRRGFSNAVVVHVHGLRVFAVDPDPWFALAIDETTPEAAFL